ncbi:MAG: hypothetical protein Q7T41_00640 [Candidatus Saccharibacteria bacterium]|nr:hypothetical protein [Candidatus Saccharibacteria bacterium]
MIGSDINTLRIVRPMTALEAEIAQYDNTTPQNRLVGFIVRSFINQQRYVDALTNCEGDDTVRIHGLIEKADEFAIAMSKLYEEQYGNEVNIDDAYNAAGNALLALCDEEVAQNAQEFQDFTNYTEIRPQGRIFVPHAGLQQSWAHCKGIEDNNLTFQ